MFGVQFSNAGLIHCVDYDIFSLLKLKKKDDKKKFWREFAIDPNHSISPTAVQHELFRFISEILIRRVIPILSMNFPFTQGALFLIRYCTLLDISPNASLAIHDSLLFKSNFQRHVRFVTFY